jgi:hypothetical protein
METLSAHIEHLDDQAAMAALELIPRRAGLAPDPFATDQPEDQLREALRQLDLLSFGSPQTPPPSDGDIARATLLYLAEQDATLRTSIAHVVSRSPGASEVATRDAGAFALGALVLLAMRTDLELRKQPGKGWYFHFKLTPLPTSALGKVSICCTPGSLGKALTPGPVLHGAE